MDTNFLIIRVSVIGRIKFTINLNNVNFNIIIASFKDSGLHGINKMDKWEAEIQYTVTAEVELLGSGRVLQVKKPFCYSSNLNE